MSTLWWCSSWIDNIPRAGDCRLMVMIGIQAWVGVSHWRWWKLFLHQLLGPIGSLEAQASVTGSSELLHQRDEVIGLSVDDLRGVSVDDDGRPVLHLRERHRRFPNSVGVLGHLQRRRRRGHHNSPCILIVRSRHHGGGCCSCACYFCLHRWW